MDFNTASSLERSPDRHVSPPHANTLSWFRASQFWLFLLNIACLAERKQLPVIDRARPTIYRIRDEHANHYTTGVVTLVEQRPYMDNSFAQLRHFWWLEQSTNLDNSMYKGTNSNYCGMVVEGKIIRLSVHGELALTCASIIFLLNPLETPFWLCKKFRLHLIFPVCTPRVRSSLYTVVHFVL